MRRRRLPSSSTVAAGIVGRLMSASARKRRTGTGLALHSTRDGRSTQIVAELQAVAAP